MPATPSTGHWRATERVKPPGLLPAPDAGQPGLLLARQSRRTIVVLEFGEVRGRKIAAPGRQIVIGTVTSSVPALLVLAAWIGAEQHTAWAQRVVQLLQDPRQHLA